MTFACAMGGKRQRRPCNCIPSSTLNTRRDGSVGGIRKAHLEIDRRHFRVLGKRQRRSASGRLHIMPILLLDVLYQGVCQRCWAGRASQ